MYIGDNPKKDFLGANKLGMQTVWIKRNNGEYVKHSPSDKEHQADYIITHISALFQEVIEHVENEAG